MVNQKQFNYGHQWIGEDDISAVVEVLKSDWLTQGPKVEEFEKMVAEYCGASYAVAFSSGTAALHAAYSILGIKEKDEVITTPLSFSATSNAIVYCGGIPVFCDIDSRTLNISTPEVEKKINNHTKAIACVDFAGQPCDLDALKKIAKKHNLFLVEDAAHSLGSLYKNQKIGSLSDLTIFSFHPVKVITTGEGGMVLTQNKEWAEKLRNFRSHHIVKKPFYGQWFYDIEQLGFNYRLTDIQCALGISQLKKIDFFIARRREIVQKYQEAFKELHEISLIQEENFAFSAWHIYPICIDWKKIKMSRQEFFERMKTKNIICQVHYIPIHLLTYYQKRFGYKKGDFPVAEDYYEKTVTLPLYPQLTNEDINYIIESVKEILYGK